MKRLLITSPIALLALGFATCTNEATEEPVSTLPVVRLISPTNASQLQDSVQVEVEARDDKGVAKVEVYIDDQIPQGGTFLVAPYRYVWDLSSYPDSSVHTVFAKAYDVDNNVSSTPILTLVLFRFAPSNLTATVFADTLVSLSWKDNSRKETGFEVEQNSNNSGFVSVKTVPANTTKTEIIGVYRTTNQIYFRVCAVSGETRSKYSNSVLVTVPFPPPANLQVSELTETQASVIWSLNNPYATMVLIERSTNASAGFALLDSVSTTSTSKSIAGRYSSDTTYYFRAQAKSKINKSDYSSVTSRRLSFPAPSDVRVISLSGSSATIQWVDNSSFETGFEIYVGLDSTNVSLVETVPANTTSKTVTAVFDVTKTYFFRVRARSQYNVSHFSAASVVVSGTPLLLDMVLVPGGTFQMGSTSGDSNEQPIHSVTLNSFYIGRYEVTQKLWREIVEWKQLNGGTTLAATPSLFKGDYLPVEQLSWNDIQLWLGYLNQREGTTKYRLPTEAEWEYAARGGNRTNGYIYSGSNVADAVAWYLSNAGMTTHSVGGKVSNELGICDMSGNVWEWCQDWLGPYSLGAQTDPMGPSTGSVRVIRGGAWNDRINTCSVTFRGSNLPDVRGNGVGFRLAGSF